MFATSHDLLQLPREMSGTIAQDPLSTRSEATTGIDPLDYARWVINLYFIHVGLANLVL